MFGLLFEDSCDSMLMLFGRLFHVCMYFSVKWSVVCVGVQVFEYWFVFGM